MSDNPTTTMSDTTSDNPSTSDNPRGTSRIVKAIENALHRKPSYKLLVQILIVILAAGAGNFFGTWTDDILAGAALAQQVSDISVQVNKNSILIDRCMQMQNENRTALATYESEINHLVKEMDFLRVDVKDLKTLVERAIR